MKYSPAHHRGLQDLVIACANRGGNRLPLHSKTFAAAAGSGCVRIIEVEPLAIQAI